MSAILSGAAIVAFFGAISPSTLWTKATIRRAVTRDSVVTTPLGNPSAS